MLRLLGTFLLIAGLSVGQSKQPAQTFDDLAKRAAEARDGDRLDEAVALYKKALAVRPKWAEGWWSLGMLEYDRNNHAAAARAFRQLLPLRPKDGTVQVLRLISGDTQLAQAAADAVRQWRFRPYRSDGRSEPFSTRLTVSFRLQ